jgi:hypothetical protein
MFLKLIRCRVLWARLNRCPTPMGIRENHAALGERETSAPRAARLQDLPILLSRCVPGLQW